MGISAEPAAFGVAAIILLILLVVLWFVIASAAVLKGGAVEPPHRMAQLYGYTVCLVAVILGLTTAASILDAAFDRMHPLQSEYSYGASLTSFEAYRATYPRDRVMMGPSTEAAPDTLSDETLRRRYDAMVSDRLAAIRFRTSKKFVTSGTLLLISAALFLLHWRWLRRIPGAVPPAA